jgi:hypothetical protein
MARRSLSTRGRILAAGVSVAVGAALMGFMAAGDHTADASRTTRPAASSANDAPTGGAATATPYDAPTGNSSFPTQPQTRTGGS